MFPYLQDCKMVTSTIVVVYANGIVERETNIMSLTWNIQKMKTNMHELKEMVTKHNVNNIVMQGTQLAVRNVQE